MKLTAFADELNQKIYLKQGRKHGGERRKCYPVPAFLTLSQIPPSYYSCLHGFESQNKFNSTKRQNFGLDQIESICRRQIKHN